MIRTKAQALAEAKRRWGAKAMIASKRCYFNDDPKRPRPLKKYEACCSGCRSGVHPLECPGNRPVFRVGAFELGLFFAIKGEGSTWDEAFARAGKR